jgi:hypothetical protein
VVHALIVGFQIPFKMSFNLDSLLQKSIESIRDFSSQHANETFYAFAIDENLLCLNSVKEFEKTSELSKAEDCN